MKSSNTIAPYEFKRVNFFIAVCLDSSVTVVTFTLHFLKHHVFPFSAMTLLVGQQEGHPAYKKLSGVVLAWLSVWREVQTCI